MRRYLIVLLLILNNIISGFAQNRITDFMTLITSSDIKSKSEIIEFIKKGDNVNEKHKFRSGLLNNRFQQKYFKNYWKSIAQLVDSLGVVDFAKDTVLICQNFNGSRAFHPYTMIVSGKVYLAINSNGNAKLLKNEEDGKSYFYDFPPILIKSIINLDLSSISDMIAKYGSEPDEFTDPQWNIVYRIVVNNYKKTYTTMIYFDRILWDTNPIIYH